MRQLKKRQSGSPTATPTTGDVAHRGRRLRLPTSTAALAVSIVALVVAMAGSAYAGVTLGKGSVGTQQLQKGAVTNGKIAKGAVGLGKLKTGLIVPNAVHANTADAATNATNAVNATNATKATTATSATTATNATTAANATALAKVTYVESATITAIAGAPTAPASTKGTVGCPAGTSAIGGGFFTSKTGLEISDSEPSLNNGATKPATGWDGFVDNFTATTGTFNVWAICTPVTAGNSQPGAVPLNNGASSR